MKFLKLHVAFDIVHKKNLIRRTGNLANIFFFSFFSFGFTEPQICKTLDYHLHPGLTQQVNEVPSDLIPTELKPPIISLIKAAVRQLYFTPLRFSQQETHSWLCLMQCFLQVVFNDVSNLAVNSQELKKVYILPLFHGPW